MNSLHFCLIASALVVLIIEPSQSLPNPGDQVCGDNEEYTSCGSSCPDSCETLLGPGKNRPCTMNCVPGCFCKQGYVRDSQNKCIQTFMCKHPRDSVQEASGGAGGGAQSAKVSLGLAAALVLLAAFIGKATAITN